MDGNTHDSGAASGWRSEEDYLFARLANTFGYLPPAAVDDVLRRQTANVAAGLPLTFSQVVTRDKLLTGEALLHVRQELARCEHRCPNCGIRRYLVPSPTPREEPCLRCGAPIPVSVVGSTVSDTHMRRRDVAIHGGSRAEGFAARRLDASAEEQLPRHFGSYTLQALIAKGAMGAVYQARDAKGDRVAVKMLLAGADANAAQRHRFRREAKAQSVLEHPHIARVRDAGEVDGVPYQVMDLVTGGDLARAYADLQQPQRVEILAKVARAIAHAHGVGYIHRDLKLGNVLLTEEREPKVTDFGLTKHLEGHTRLTQEGAVVGTPFYMSPEQVTGRVDDIGPRSDVYALGVMLYELCTGALPFVAESSVELARMILEMRPPPFAEKGVMAPELEQVAFRAMEKDPELRYPDAAAFAEDLERIGRGEAPLAAHVGASERMARQLQRHRGSLGALAAVALVGMTLLIGLALGFRAYRAGVQRERIQRVCGEALTALEASIDGTGWGATPPTESDDQLLAAQRALDEEGGALLEPAQRDPLQARLRTAMLALAQRHLRSGTCAGARRARELIVDADATQEPKAAAAVARAALRLGLDPAPALALLPADHPEAARVRGLAQLLSGNGPAKAVPALEPVPEGPPLVRLDARGFHALAQIRAGQREAGHATLVKLRAEAGSESALLRRLADLHILAGLRADAAALEQASGEPEQVGAALAARAAAIRRDPTVEEDLEPLLAAIQAEDPRDLIPPPEVATALRDIAWALRNVDPRRIDPRAGPLVERALLRRPDDLDLLFLRRLVTPKLEPERLQAVAEAELLDLSRPLGRGMFLARLAKIHTGPLAQKLKEQATALLKPVLERWPSLVPVEDELRLLGGDPLPVRISDPLGWNRLLPPVRKLPPRPTAPMRARAKGLTRQSYGFPEGSLERIAKLRAALRVTPRNADLAFKLAVERHRRQRARVEGFLGWLIYLRTVPYAGFRVFHKLRREWIESYLLHNFKPAQALTQALAVKDHAADLRLLAAVIHYFGRVYPRGENEPDWPTQPPAQLLREVDRALLLDPYLYGFLGVRGHLLEVAGDATGCDREFRLLNRLTEPHGYRGHLLHRAWATAKSRPRVATDAVERVKLRALTGDDEQREVLEFLSLDPLMLGIRETSAIMRLTTGRGRGR